MLKNLGQNVYFDNKYLVWVWIYITRFQNLCHLVKSKKTLFSLKRPILWLNLDEILLECLSWKLSLILNMWLWVKCDQKCCVKVKSYCFYKEDTLINKYLWSQVKMFILTKSVPSLNLGHLRPKLGQIWGKTNFGRSNLRKIKLRYGTTPCPRNLDKLLSEC